MSSEGVWLLPLADVSQRDPTDEQLGLPDSMLLTDSPAPLALQRHSPNRRFPTCGSLSNISRAYVVLIIARAGHGR